MKGLYKNLDRRQIKVIKIIEKWSFKGLDIWERNLLSSIWIEYPWLASRQMLFDSLASQPQAKTDAFKSLLDPNSRPSSLGQSNFIKLSGHAWLS